MTPRANNKTSTYCIAVIIVRYVKCDDHCSSREVVKISKIFFYYYVLFNKTQLRLRDDVFCCINKIEIPIRLFALYYNLYNVLSVDQRFSIQMQFDDILLIII